jgi:hypothetical protein
VDTPTPAPRPRLPQRLRTALAWLPWLLLLALLADHGWLMLEWARRDSGFALPVFSGAAHPVSETLAQVAAEGWGAVLSSPKPAIFAWLPVALLYLTGPDLAVLTWTNALLMLLSMALIFDAGRLLGGPWAGLVAACALPLLPDVALLEHRWSAGMLQLPLLIGSFDLLIRSCGLSRPLPALGIAVLAWVLLQAADMETENLYALAPLAAMLGAALARGVLSGHGPVGGQRIGRFLPLLFGAMVAGAATWALLRSGHLLPSLAYVQRETAAGANSELAPRWSWATLTACPRFWAMIARRTVIGPLLDVHDQQAGRARRGKQEEGREPRLGAQEGTQEADDPCQPEQPAHQGLAVVRFREDRPALQPEPDAQGPGEPSPGPEEQEPAEPGADDGDRAQDAQLLRRQRCADTYEDGGDDEQGAQPPVREGQRADLAGTDPDLERFISQASPVSRSTPRRTRSGAWGHLTDDRRTGCCPSRPTRRSPGRR